MAWEVCIRSRSSQPIMRGKFTHVIPSFRWYLHFCFWMTLFQTFRVISELHICIVGDCENPWILAVHAAHADAAVQWTLVANSPVAELERLSRAPAVGA